MHEIELCVRNRKYSVHRANFIGLARSRFLCGGGLSRWGQAWGPRDRNVTNLAKTSTPDNFELSNSKQLLYTALCVPHV